MNLYLVINCLEFLSPAYAVAIQPPGSSFLGGREIATKDWVIIWRIVGSQSQRNCCMAHLGSVMSESTDSRNPSIFLLWRTVFDLGKENPSERDFICLISEEENPSE
jgi:hypothetical protein